MKALLIIGILLFVGGIVYGSSISKTRGDASGPPVKGSPTIVPYTIGVGFILMVVSGVMYLRK